MANSNQGETIKRAKTYLMQNVLIGAAIANPIIGIAIVALISTGKSQSEKRQREIKDCLIQNNQALVEIVEQVREATQSIEELLAANTQAIHSNTEESKRTGEKLAQSLNQSQWESINRLEKLIEKVTDESKATSEALHQLQNSLEKAVSI